MRIPTKKEMYKALEERMGSELCEKFSSASVAICGLGGLGSNIAIALARAGVGRLHIIDFDVVDISNLNRQQYAISQLGMEKTKAMRENILAIAPYCNVVTNQVRVTERNLKELFSHDDIICEAFDKPENKAMLVNGVLECFSDKFLVAGSGMAGMGSANLIRTRKISERFILCGDGISDVEDGLALVSARVLACAAHQAHAVLQILAGISP